MSRGWTGSLLPLLTVLCYSQVLAYPNGGPSSTCINNFPKHHGTQQQNSPTPFTLSFSPTSYLPGSIITVTVTSKTGQREFVGFQVNAKAKFGDTESLVGTFPKADLPADAWGSFWWPVKVEGYASAEANCVHHADNRRRTEVILKWKAPATSVGPIVFNAGIVEDFATFWVAENKAVLQADDPIVPAANPAYVVNSIVTPAIRYEGECGRTKGCLLYPAGCRGADCRYAVSYKSANNDSAIDFEMMGVNTGYLSLAFSYDVTMGKDLTTTCVEKDGIFSVQNGYNPGLYNHRHPIEGVYKMQVNRSGDRLWCRFTRDINAHTVDISREGVPSRLDFPLTKSWIIFLAFGDVYERTDIPGKHIVLPLVSDGEVYLTKTDIVSARILHTTLRAHGSLGVISWIAMVGFAIIIARFYKITLGKKVLGSALWFQVHRTLVLTAILLSIIGIIIIFVYLKMWSTKATLHGAFGLVAVGLATVQVFGALLRPAPGTSRRSVFNWVHRSGGLLAYICAAVCVLLAFQVEVIGEPLRLQGTSTVAAWLVFYVIWFFMLQVVEWLRDRNKADVETVTKNTLSVQEAAPSDKSAAWRHVYVVWLVVGIIVTLALVVLMLYFINTA